MLLKYIMKTRKNRSNRNRKQRGGGIFDFLTGTTDRDLNKVEKLQKKKDATQGKMDDVDNKLAEAQDVINEKVKKCMEAAANEAQTRCNNRHRGRRSGLMRRRRMPKKSEEEEEAEDNQMGGSKKRGYKNRKQQGGKRKRRTNKRKGRGVSQKRRNNKNRRTRKQRR